MLQNSKVVFLRLLWFFTVAGVLFIYIAGFPTRVTHLTTIVPHEKNYSLQLSPPLATTLEIMSITPEAYFLYILTLELVVTAVFLVSAGIIFRYRAADPPAILVSLLLVTFGATQTEFTSALVRADVAWHWAVETLQAVTVVLSLLVFYIFPDGRFVPAWTRPLALIYVVLVVVWLCFPQTPFNFVYGSRFDDTLLLSLIVAVCWYGTGLFALMFRYRYVATEVQRQQMKWVVFGLLIACISAIVRFSVPALLQALNAYESNYVVVIQQLVLRPGFWLGSLAVPVCVIIAIFRYRLWDIDVIFNRAIVYTLMTGGVIGIYSLIVSSLGLLLGDQDNFVISLMGTGAVAVLFQPLRERVQRTVNYLVYGERDDPYKLLVRLDQRLQAAFAPELAFTSIIETIAAALKLPYVSISLKRGEELVVMAEYVSPGFKNRPAPDPALPDCPVFSLTYQSHVLGELRVAPRAGEKQLHQRDQALLDDLARHAGVVAYSIQLSADLRHAHEQLLASREAERRRLRHELHDGLGPQLASLRLILAAARTHLPHAPEKAESLLHELAENIEVAVKDIRHIVHSLHPSALDELGLAGAIRSLVEQAKHTPLRIHLEMPQKLPVLSKTVESALYRIIQEALTNVIRHARAKKCCIRIASDPLSIQVEVEDDGIGISEDQPMGIGLKSMRERTDTIGGAWKIVNKTPTGTCISVTVPLM